jgi:hypothetical protein
MARGWRASLTATTTTCTAPATATAATLRACPLSASLRGTAALRVHSGCQTCERKDSDDQSACSHETPPRKPVEIKAISSEFKGGSMAQKQPAVHKSFDGYSGRRSR